MLSFKDYNKTGCYVSVKPLFSLRLNNYLFELNKILTVNNDLHCTLIYDRNCQDYKTFNNNENKNSLYRAKPKEYMVYPGHDNTGYLVLKMESVNLNNRYKELRQLGLNHSFDEYLCHMTLASGFGNCEEFKTKYMDKIKNIEMPDIILFSGETFESIKED